MKMLLCLLVWCATLACMGGCIPIGVRGSTFAAAESQPCVAPSEIDTPLLSGAATARIRKHPTQAALRCA